MLKIVFLACLAVGLVSSKAVNEKQKRQLPSEIVLPTLPADDTEIMRSMVAVLCNSISYNIKDIYDTYIGGHAEAYIFDTNNPPTSVPPITVVNAEIDAEGVNSFPIFYSELEQCTMYNISVDVYGADPSVHTFNTISLQTLCTCGGGEGTGDPHYRTIDGHKFDFNGECSYVLLQDCENNPPHWQINVQHGMLTGGKARRIVGVSAITTNPREHEVSIHQNARVVLDGHTYHDGIFWLPNMSLENTNVPDTKRLYLNEHKVWVSYGNHLVNLGLSEDDGNWQGKVCGLLGNNNGNPDDDFMMRNGEMTDDAEEFGNSWMVPNSCK